MESRREALELLDGLPYTPVRPSCARLRLRFQQHALRPAVPHAVLDADVDRRREGARGRRAVQGDLRRRRRPVLSIADRKQRAVGVVAEIVRDGCLLRGRKHGRGGRVRPLAWGVRAPRRLEARRHLVRRFLKKRRRGYRRVQEGQAVVQARLRCSGSQVHGRAHRVRRRAFTA